MKNKKTWDIITFIVWTFAFIINFHQGIDLFDYTFMYIAFLCEFVKNICFTYSKKE